jgi:hypothetical protein
MTCCESMDDQGSKGGLTDKAIDAYQLCGHPPASRRCRISQAGIRLVIFYNVDFGIDAGDHVYVRRHNVAE